MRQLREPGANERELLGPPSQGSKQYEPPDHSRLVLVLKPSQST